jgi:hypothetical protein
MTEWVQAADPDTLLAIGLVAGQMLGMLLGCFLVWTRWVEPLRNEVRLQKEYNRIDKEHRAKQLEMAKADADFYSKQYHRFTEDMTKLMFRGDRALVNRVVRELNEKLTRSYIDPKTLIIHDKKAN